MAKQRMINVHFWDDGFVRKLHAGDKLLYLYLLTNPCTTIAGAYEITLERMKFDTGMDEKRLLDAIKKLSDAGKITYRDEWMLIHNFIKNQSKSDTVEAGIVAAANCCPDWIKDTLSIRYPYLPIYLNSDLNIKPKRKWNKKVVEVFEEWKTVLSKKSSLDAKRHSILADRLKDFTVAELKLVPHGVLHSPWHNGENPKGKKYHEVSTVFRDNEQVEKFIELARVPKAITTTINQPSARELIRMEQEQIRQEFTAVQ